MQSMLPIIPTMLRQERKHTLSFERTPGASVYTPQQRPRSLRLQMQNRCDLE